MASCLDLCLAAQGESFPDAKKKLEGMIKEYVFDALAGEDRAYADQLLSRKAPLQEWAKYYSYMALSHLGGMKDGMRKLFIEPIPLSPCK